MNEEKKVQIEKYIKLLKEYNEKINVYSKKAYDKLDFHIQDSINIAEIIGNTKKRVIDMGSGSGLPAVIIAIANESNLVTAVESKKKKCDLLFHVKHKLKLDNLKVINEDVNKIIRDEPADFYTAKAFKKIPEIIKMKVNFKKHSKCIIPISANQVQELNSISVHKSWETVSIKDCLYLILKN
ncbi:16S rRNA (guanine(527)-N(7))-methyltransferase RsmG [Candidatus Margulisiibacteriota bacterium]